MAVASIELQKAIYSALNNLYPVYDALPSQSPMPHINIGEETLMVDDTKSEKRSEHIITVHFWSNARGSGEVKTMMDQVMEVLFYNDLTVVGFEVVNKSQMSQQTVKEIDGTKTFYHGIKQINFKLMEV